MATLAGTVIADTYDSLLHVEDNTAGLVATSTDSRVIQDGVGANSALALATDSVRITSTNKLYFNDVGGEYISGNGSILSIVGGSEIDLTATAIDINGTVDMSSTLNVAGNVTFDGGTFVFNNSEADKDFRIAGDSETNLLFCDASTDRVGIGTASPATLFHSQSPNNAQLRHEVTGANGLALFQSKNDAQTWSFGVDGSASDAFIWSRDAGTTDLLQLTTNGKFGVGTVPDQKFHVKIPDGTEDQWICYFENEDDAEPNGILISYPNFAASAEIDNNFIQCASSDGVEMFILADGDLQNGDGTYGTISSDERIKRDIQDATGKLDDLNKLSVKNFIFKRDSRNQKQIGFLAQEFEKVFPSLVTTRDATEEGGYADEKGLKIGMEFAILVKAIQELSAKVTALENA